MGRVKSERHGRGDLPSLPLFETKEAKGKTAYRVFAGSIMFGICLVWFYRATHIPKQGRWAWIGLFLAEIWFSFYWIITQSVRWNIVHRRTFKDRLSQRHGEKLPGVDIFVCTADPIIEPPTMVINTVLSVMAYDYPPEKLSVYLSDDGGSDLTFYALLEASHFSMCWIPFCKKFKVEPRSPAAYFAQKFDPLDCNNDREWLAMKEMYIVMKRRIETTTKLGRIPDDIREQHPGFSEWNSNITKNNHQTIIQILIDGRDPNVLDNEGHPLPSLVYLAREKRHHHPHNFKAGAMNALIRVSSEISNGDILLNVDCDMYSNSSGAVRDASCFFMDEESGQEIAYVQFPQSFNNLGKHDLYGSGFKIINNIEVCGMDGLGGPMYIGTGCFHRRETLCGRKYSKDYKPKWNIETTRKIGTTLRELEERSKVLASCTYEENTQWGNEMGLKYGCASEDVMTGLSIHCRGWKSAYYNPNRKGFLGVSPINMDISLVQYKRWSEGLFQIFFSKYCPFFYGFGKINLGQQMGYSVYCLWGPNSFPTLFYVVVPSLCFLNGIPLFPKISSQWFLPFAYVFLATNVYSLLEMLRSEGTLKCWWNLQRMSLFRNVTSFLFGTIDTILKKFGLSQLTFTVTTKVVDGDVSERYTQEMLEFGNSSMFTIITTIALFNLFILLGGLKQVVLNMDIKVIEPFLIQTILCGLMVLINIPVYEAMFIRKDKGRISFSITFMSIVVASFACIMPIY